MIEATSKYLHKNNEDDAILYGDVETHFFNEKNEHISILTADTAKINELNNNFNAQFVVETKYSESLSEKIFSLIR